MEKMEFNCPDCKNILNDVRDQDDRIDFWCKECRTAFSYDNLNNINREEISKHEKKES